MGVKPPGALAIILLQRSQLCPEFLLVFKDAHFVQYLRKEVHQPPHELFPENQQKKSRQQPRLGGEPHQNQHPGSRAKPAENIRSDGAAHQRHHQNRQRIQRQVHQKRHRSHRSGNAVPHHQYGGSRLTPRGGRRDGRKINVRRGVHHAAMQPSFVPQRPAEHQQRHSFHHNIAQHAQRRADHVFQIRGAHKIRKAFRAEGLVLRHNGTDGQGDQQQEHRRIENLFVFHGGLFASFQLPEIASVWPETAVFIDEKTLSRVPNLHQFECRLWSVSYKVGS